MSTFLKVVIGTATVGFVASSITGWTYMDGIPPKEKPNDDVCNPQYWFPKQIPDHCLHKDVPPPRPHLQPIPVPLPVQLPPVGVVPFPPLPPGMPSPPLSFPYLPAGAPDPCICAPCRPPPIAVPLVPLPNPCCPACPAPVPPPPMYNPQPLPFGIPIAPTNPMVPVPGYPYNPYAPYPPYSPYQSMYPRSMIGMVPGLPGIVSEDGGINVLPFSDAYSDLLEKHKNKEFRRKYRRLIKDYEKRH